MNFWGGEDAGPVLQSPAGVSVRRGGRGCIINARPRAQFKGVRRLAGTANEPFWFRLSSGPEH
jgi:hypothetical protein